MKYRIFKSILSYTILGLALLACNKTKSDTESDLHSQPISRTELSTLPDSIIDAGIVHFSLFLSWGGNQDSYYSKAVKAHDNYLRIRTKESLNKEELNSYYSKAIHNYSLSLDKKEKQNREHVVLQNRAALKVTHGDYYGALSDYSILLNEPNRNGQEYSVLQAYCYLKIGEIEKSEAIIDSIITKYLDIKLNTKNSSASTDNSENIFELPDIRDDNTFLASAFYYKGVISYLKADKLLACQSWSKVSDLNEKVSRYAALDAIKLYCTKSFD